MMTPGAVFDCNIFLQAAVRDTGPSYACITAVEAGIVRLFVSASVINEVTNVLNREKTRRKFPVLTPEYVEAFTRRIIALSSFIADVPAVFSYPRDPKDEAYVDLAITTGARYLVSRDKDLLELMDAETLAAQTVQRLAPGLRILDPVVFLRRVLPQETGA